MAKERVFLYTVLLCIAGALGGTAWTDLSVTFGVTSGYYGIPLTLDGILHKGMVFMVHDHYLNTDFYAYQNDPRVAIGFDKNGSIAGVRISYIKTDVPAKAEAKNLTFPYDYDSNSLYGNSKYFGIKVWYTTVLFTSPDVLKAGGRTDTKGLLADDIYVKLNGNWTVMPRKESEAKSSGFVRQGCFVGLGRHYYYNFSSESDCASATPVFLNYGVGKDLTGMGFSPFGSFTNGDTIEWFEDVSTLRAKVIVPNQPSCLNDWINNYGISSIHLFFCHHPRLTMCLPWS